MKWILCRVVLSGMIVLSACEQKDSSHLTATKAATLSTASPTAAKANASQQSLPSNWMYNTIPGNSFNKSRYTATVDSSNTLNFAFPYNGPQHPTLVLRSDGAVLVLFNGQIDCGIENCQIQTKFDDGPVGEVTVSKPDDGSTGVFYFFADAPGFVKHLIASKKLALNINFYQEGRQEVDYNLSGLNLGKIQGWFALSKSDIPNALCLQELQKQRDEGILRKQTRTKNGYVFYYMLSGAAKSGMCTYSDADKSVAIQIDKS
ncbi:MAG TPA: hypothetical protein VGO35_10975 [Gammaproteobacteria bacterium]|jgi:hypothetical protein|nr:hypothetical protein [Gammaproteobacteria bacterium]